MPDLHALKRELERLNILWAIRGEREDEDELALALVLLLLAYLDDRDAEAFRLAFLKELRDSYETLDPDGIYDFLIRRELADQAGYLSGFIQDLRNNKLSEAQAKARAKSYASSLGKLKQRIEIEPEPRQRRARWQRNPDLENCPDCLELDGQVHTYEWYITLNHIPKSDAQRCRQH